MSTRNSPGIKRDKVTSFFKKFKENRQEEEREGSLPPTRGASRGTDSPSRESSSQQRVRQQQRGPPSGATSLVTQGQELVKARITTAHPSANGRNFSPVNAAHYEPLLPHPSSQKEGMVCLVLDLDETLVHSSFRPVPMPDMVLPIDIDGTLYHVYVKKRPFIEEFIKFISPIFEVVVFTASLSKYADPLLDQLDPGKKLMGHLRLFREHCSHTNGAYVKDLSLLGRPLPRICIIDNSPVAYLFQSQYVNNLFFFCCWIFFKKKKTKTGMLCLVPHGLRTKKTPN